MARFIKLYQWVGRSDVEAKYLHSFSFRRFSLLILLIICFICNGMAAYAGDTQWRVKQITNEDGLSNSAVNHIYKDRQGFMWFGTWDGLNQYDGKSMVSFYPDNLSQYHISNNIIWDIFEDHMQNLWIITERGINRFDYESDRFDSWFDEIEQYSSRENSLRAVIGPENELWLAVYGNGLYRFSDEDQDFVEVELAGLSENQHQNVVGIFACGDSLLLLHEHHQLTGFMPESSDISIIDLSDCFLHEDVRIDLSWFYKQNGSGFIAFPCMTGGIKALSLNNHKFIVYQDDHFPSLVTALYASEEDSSILLGTDDGNILELDMSDGGGFRSLLDKIPEFAEKKVKIWSIFKTDDLIWIGTDGEGVFLANMQPKPFFNIERGEAHERRINHKIVRAVYEDQYGNLWVGTRGNGLNMIPAHGGATKVYNSLNGLSNDAVLSLAVDHSNNLWIGVDGPGVDILNMETGKISHLPDDLITDVNLEFGSVYSICVDAFGTVWLGTSGYGLFGLNVSMEGAQYILNHYTHLPGSGQDNDLRGNIVFSVKEERPNILWIGARMAGLHRFNTLTQEVQYYGQASQAGLGLNNPDVLSLLIGSDKTLWIGTSGGLNKVRLGNPILQFEYFTGSEGLPNHTIHAILEDASGNIWISTNKGLSRYLIEESRFVNYNSGDGLLNNEYTDGAAFHHLPSGRLYFGGINGLDWFYPNMISISADQPEVIITNFTLFNKTIKPGDDTGILDVNINFADKIKLRHNQNFFGFEFTSLNYQNAARNNFAYKLENFNVDWVDAGSQRAVNFTNVPYGKYRLLLRAANEDGSWSERIKEIEILIMPPFWLTYAAFSVYAILLILIIIAVYRYQTRRIKKRQQQQLEKINRQKERELNQYKFEFFTNLAHEFRTPLTLIIASAATLFSKEGEGKANHLLNKSIYTNARRLQHMIDELLAFQKLDSGREMLALKPGELVSYMSGIIEIFLHYANEKELELSFEPEVPELHVAFDGDKIERILLNLLSNAIKYTPPGGSVTVKLEVKDETVIITVKDTGIGIPIEILPNVFDRYFHHNPDTTELLNAPKGSGIGLAYTRSLVELHNGMINVESEVNVGTTFKVSLPISSKKLRGINHDEELSKSRKDRLLESIAEEYFQQHDIDFVGHESTSQSLGKASKYRILIVEDDIQLLQLLESLLSEYYDIVTAINGAKALDILKQKRIDLVVSDVMMPEMDGLALCKNIKSDLVTSHVPVVLLTARAATEQLIEGLETGADSYITKPFHPRYLQLSIEKLLKTREMLTADIRKNPGQQTKSIERHLSNRDRKLLDKCFKYLSESYYMENLNADQLADHLALSKAQLYRKIKAITGLTPHGLIKNFRLNKAREMIIEAKYNISDIVFMTGFNNRTYFYRSYRELFGETPGEILKNNKTTD